MPDIVQTILSNIEDDPTLKVRKLDVRLVKGKGLFNRRKVVQVTGEVDSEQSKTKVIQIAQRWAGDNYDVVNKISVGSA